MTSRLRWLAIAIFALANALNFMDRQILAALAPQLKQEFHITNAGYGDVLLAFSLCYALAAPLAGLLIDRVGLTTGSSLAVGIWSLAGMATGWTTSLGGLIACRAALGVGEAGGVPATGKASAVYLPPRERALGSAVFQVGLTIGAIASPLLAETISRAYGWRSAFVFIGALGFVWIPLWWFVSRRVPREGEAATAVSTPVLVILRDRRYWALLASNVLLMSVYSLWVNWTTVFLVDVHHMPQQQANYHLAWIPPVFATAGGLFGGWLTLRWAKGQSDVTPARLRVILIGSALLLAGALVPFMPTPELATAFICLSFFACVASSVNIYALPLDLFGVRSAGFAVSGLTSVYGLLQGVFSSAVGRVVDRYGFTPVCFVVALLPMHILARPASRTPAQASMKQRIKRVLFSLLGKDAEAVVVAATPLAATMRELTPDRRLIVIESIPGESTGAAWLRLHRECGRYRIALAAIPTAEKALLRAALLTWPNKVLAFHDNLDRHHIRVSTPIASALFLGGVPLDRIFLRPRRDNGSVLPQTWRAMDGRPWREGKLRVAVLSPYCTFPLAHGGAVRLHNLLRETSAEFDIALFAFEDGQTQADFDQTLAFCSRLYIAAKPYYREPRWSTVTPPEVCEFYTPALHAQLRDELARFNIPILQTDYTQMARYGGDILTEHDVTFDLFAQIHAAAPSLSTWWNLFRWNRFERRALRRFPCVVAMSEKDAGLIGGSKVSVIPNGVDLVRFTPEPEPDAQNLLFIGSFRHFPNVRAYRFFAEQVWPLLENQHPAIRATVVAGPNPQLYWPHPSPDPRIDLRGFTADVRPLYVDANLVLIPTVVSAGTNLKALEAMAMRRAIVSTSSGVAGLGLDHGRSVWIADTPQDFAAAILRLLNDPDLRDALAGHAREIAVAKYGWPALAELQTHLWRSRLAR